MSNNKCKVEIPNQLPESGLTRVQFKTWKESMIVYLKQNDNFLPFQEDSTRTGNQLKRMRTGLHLFMQMIVQPQQQILQQNLPSARRIC